MRPIREVPDRDNAKHHGRNSFDDKEPAPPPHPEPRQTQQQASKRRADDIRKRIRRVEKCHGFGPVLISKPMRKVDDDTWKKPGLRRANQEAYDIELP